MLTQHQINEFRNILEHRYQDVREDIREALLRTDDESYIEIAGQVRDMENSSVADLLVDVALADIDRQVEEIRDIDAALLRIANGDYGVCADCGEFIDVRRLEAYPTAKRCRPCQTSHENRSAAPHRNSL